MEKTLFDRAINLLDEYDLPKLRETKLSLIAIVDNSNSERNIVSKQVLKTLHNRRRASFSKHARIVHINEKLLPKEVQAFQKPIISDFVDVKQGSLLRIRRLLREKERLSKLTSEHDLKAKTNLRSLCFVYTETQRINDYIQLLDAVESLYIFFSSERNKSSQFNRRRQEEYI